MSAVPLPTQAGDFPAWYGEVVQRAGLAEHASVRGAMVIKPYGYAIWEAIQRELDARIKATGHENFYFPLLVPASVLAQESELVDAVAACCASGVAYRIGDDRYIDGGYRRNENADLAAGYRRVLVLSPFGGRTRMPLEWRMQLAVQIDELRAGGSRVETIFPDRDSEHLLGGNAMDASLRPSAARAGYDTGRARAEPLSAFWR
jgi:hypothetical protein